MVQLKFNMSDDLEYWAAAERIDSVILRMRITSVSETDRFRIMLNGTPLILMGAEGGSTLAAGVGFRRINEMYRMSLPRYRPYVLDLNLVRTASGYHAAQGSSGLCHVCVCVCTRIPA